MAMIQNLRNRTNTKEIFSMNNSIFILISSHPDLLNLEELSDKQNRDRLWDIYLGVNARKPRPTLLNRSLRFG